MVGKSDLRCLLSVALIAVHKGYTRTDFGIFQMVHRCSDGFAENVFTDFQKNLHEKTQRGQ